MSKRGPGNKRRRSPEPKLPPKITGPDERPPAKGGRLLPDETVDADLDRARKIGMIMDPATTITPEEIRRITDEMIQLGLIEPVVMLEGPLAGERYGPTKDFLETFLDVRKQYLDKAKTEEEKGSATSFALSDTVKYILENTEPTVDKGVMLARHMNYFFVMAMYMSMPGMHERFGIGAWDFFPPILKKKAMERRAKEQKMAGERKAPKDDDAR